MQTDPTRFVSGGDDCTVRLWSIREEAPTAVIDAKANVCSVQFSPVSSNLLAFGSANYRVYLYDLRQMQVILALCCPDTAHLAHCTAGPSQSGLSLHWVAMARHKCACTVCSYLYGKNAVHLCSRYRVAGACLL